MYTDVLIPWVAALRSGKYQQATGKLRRLDDGFCCLGVLCDIVKDKVNGSWREDYKFVVPDKRSPTKVYGSDIALVETVMEYIGVDEIANSELKVALPLDHPVIRHMSGLTSDQQKVIISLSVLNDRGVSFNEIANIIEQYIPREERPALVVNLMDKIDQLNFVINTIRLPLGIDPSIRNDDVQAMVIAINKALGIKFSHEQTNAT